MTSFTLKVVSKKIETADTVTFSFKQPVLKKIRYRAGQYITICLNINGRKYRRPYSFSSAPLVDQSLDISIKRVPGGIVSNYMIDEIEVGDLIEILEPMGEFVLPSDTGAVGQLFLWGAGSGITPLFSILKTALHQHPGVRVVLINCVRNPDEIIFNKELLSLASEYADTLHSIFYFSQSAVQIGHISCFHERISERNIKRAFTFYDPSVPALHYICGPAAIKALIKTTLFNLGMKEEAVFCEDFDHVINEEDLKDIKTESVVFHVSGSEKKIVVSRGQSILDAGLDAGLELPYSCQNGTCTLCKAKIKNGLVKIISDSKPDKEILADECLLCCAYPLDSNIDIHINN